MCLAPLYYDVCVIYMYTVISVHVDVRIHVVETWIRLTIISRSYVWHGKYKWGKFIWQH
jgi:hypothetical protein